MIELSVPDDGQEVDLFVSPKSNRQRVPPRDSDHVFGNFTSPRDGIKRITIQPTNAELEGAEALLISVHGFSRPGAASRSESPARYTLRAKAADPHAASPELGEASSSPHRSADEQQCDNCLQWVP